MGLVCILPAFRAYHALAAVTPDLAMAFAIDAVRPVKRCRAMNQRYQTFCIEIIGHLPSTPFNKGGHKIHQANEFRYLSRGRAGHLGQKWDAEHLIVHGARFFEVFMTTRRITVIGREYKDRVVLNATLPNGIQYPADAVINQRNIAVVFGNDVLPPRPVLAFKVPLLVLTQMRRRLTLKSLVEIRPGRDGLRIIHRTIGFRWSICEMRGNNIHSQEKGFVARRSLAQHGDPLIGHPGSRMLLH